MSWHAIANHLNCERLKRGEPGNLTPPAVYSRFIRNGERITAALGEVGFDPKGISPTLLPPGIPAAEV
jgi:hypothetical protein